MQSEQDYYKVLGVAPGASAVEIKEAYTYKVNILHPDRLAAMPERIRRLAEEELKSVNVAYGVLSNPESRRQYDIDRFGTKGASSLQKTKVAGRSQPEVYPKVIRFKDVLPYVKQKEPFFVRNTGGPFAKVLISNPPEWIRIAKTIPLQPGEKLPMQVNVEAIGVQWGKLYSSELVVRLDESEARVKVELRTRKKPR